MTVSTAPLSQVRSAGWTATLDHEGEVGVLLLKPRPDGEEWSILDPEVLDAGRALSGQQWTLCTDETGAPYLVDAGRTACCGRPLYGLRREVLATDPLEDFDALTAAASTWCCGWRQQPEPRSPHRGGHLHWARGAPRRL